MTRLPRHPWLAACLPAALAGALTAIAFLDNTGRNLVVRRTLFAAAFIILVWNAVLTVRARRAKTRALREGAEAPNLVGVACAPNARSIDRIGLLIGKLIRVPDHLHQIDRTCRHGGIGVLLSVGNDDGGRPY